MSVLIHAEYASINTCGSVFYQYLNKPAWDPLLPAPLPEPHYRPYTLVIDLDDMLVHSNWDVGLVVHSAVTRTDELEAGS